MRVDIEDLIAEENRVAARLVWHGNQRETGGEYHQIGIVVLRLDGKGHIAERWSVHKSITTGGLRPCSIINTYRSPRRPIEEVVRYKM